MADDTEATLPAVVLDEDGKRLQLQAEKAKYLETIAKARQGTAEAKSGSLNTVVPSVTDAPKGEVTLGEKAGAFGPWRAHQVIDGTARRIAEYVPKLLAGTSDPRVLVVDNRSLLPSDWTAHYVRSTLDRLSTRLGALDNQIADALQRLNEAITEYETEEAAQGPTADEPRVNRRRGADQGGTADTAGPAVTTGATASTTASGPGAPAGTLDAAVNLLGLLRTDYTITATAVSATPSELATLTAGHLAAQVAKEALGGDAQNRVTVEADAFSTMRPSPCTNRLTAILAGRDNAVQAISAVQARLTPVDAELTSIKARIALVEQTWATATAENQNETVTAPLRFAVEQLVQQASRREKAAGPARTVIAHAQQVIADVDATVAALLKAPEGGEASLLTAVQRERLDARVTAERITHVLYVNLDAVAADAVTRRSILGTSGRIRFLSAGNASWLLLTTSSGTIAGGGQVSLADAMTFGLEDGNAQFKPAGEGLHNSDVGSMDPLNRLENWAKGLIVALVLILFVMGVLSVLSFLAVIKVALS
jgi:hypothetical protein